MVESSLVNVKTMQSNGGGLLDALDIPLLSADEQVVALTIYQLMAQTGKPVAVQQVADFLGRSTSEVANLISPWNDIQINGNNDIDAFMGLTTKFTRHRLHVNGNDLYTWCAWDTLFIPRLLGMPAQIYSLSPVDETPIELSIQGYQVEHSSSRDIVVSFRMPDENFSLKKIVSHFCCHIHFFENNEVGQRWRVDRPGIQLLTLEAAIEMGRMFNQSRFPIFENATASDCC